MFAKLFVGRLPRLGIYPIWPGRNYKEDIELVDPNALDKEAYELITRGRNREVCDMISAKRGYFITGADIERGSFSVADGDDDPTFIEVEKMLKGGGLKIRIFTKEHIDSGQPGEFANLERIPLPEGGMVFAPKA